MYLQLINTTVGSRKNIFKAMGSKKTLYFVSHNSHLLSNMWFGVEQWGNNRTLGFLFHNIQFTFIAYSVYLISLNYEFVLWNKKPRVLLLSIATDLFIAFFKLKCSLTLWMLNFLWKQRNVLYIKMCEML